MRNLGLEPVPKLNFSVGHDIWLGKYSRMVSTDTYYGTGFGSDPHEYCFYKQHKDNNDLNRPSGNILNAGKGRVPGFTRISVSAFLVVCSIFLLVISLGCQRNEEPSTLKTGFAKVEITPPVGYPSYRGQSTGVGTPLYVKALVFKQGKSHGALLICDVLIVTANEQIREVELTAGIGHESGVSFNRRRLMTNGKVAWNPGFQNPEMVRPTGPIDPDVHFVMFKPTDKEKFSASLTVFANHTDTRGGTKFHADYPFFLQKLQSSRCPVKSLLNWAWT